MTARGLYGPGPSDDWHRWLGVEEGRLPLAMNRRRFVERSLAAGAALACTGGVAAAGAQAVRTAGSRSRTGTAPTAYGAPKGEARGRLRAAGWGVQLYTLRSLMARDVEGTLAEVAQMGYREVEFAGYFGRSPPAIRAALDAEGLAAPAVHLSLDELRSSFGPAASAAGEIGHRYLVLPYLSPAERPGSSASSEPSSGRVGGERRAARLLLDGYRRLAEEMNHFGERSREAGLRFAYHNHDFELERAGDTCPLDILIENTDPDLVSFEVDLFWLVHGGGDPFDYFQRYPGRFELCHVKDRTADGDMVDVGAGDIDFEAIFERSSQAGLVHYFVEHDAPADPLASVRASLEHLESFDE